MLWPEMATSNESNEKSYKTGKRKGRTIITGAHARIGIIESLVAFVALVAK